MSKNDQNLLDVLKSVMEKLHHQPFYIMFANASYTPETTSKIKRVISLGVAPSKFLTVQIDVTVKLVNTDSMYEEKQDRGSNLTSASKCRKSTRKNKRKIWKLS